MPYAPYVEDPNYGPPIVKDNSPVKLLTLRDLQLELRMSYRGVREFVKHYIRPIDGCVRVGSRLLIHKWALNHALEQRVWDGRRVRRGRYQPPLARVEVDLTPLDWPPPSGPPLKPQ